jgi:hypothetical protein
MASFNFAQRVAGVMCAVYIGGKCVSCAAEQARFQNLSARQTYTELYSIFDDD